MTSAGELESGNAGEPAKLIRQRYREAADIIRKEKNVLILLIVNATLMNIAHNPQENVKGVQLADKYSNEAALGDANDDAIKNGSFFG